MKKGILSFYCAAFALGCSAQIPLDYYASLDGLTGRELKQAVNKIINTDVKMLSYGSGNYATWWGFYITDMTDNGGVRDRYSAKSFIFGNRGSSTTGMNIEHSFPKSWWGGAQNNAYKDLFNLMPCEKEINSSKSNYPMGKVDVASTNNGVTKIGTKTGDPTSNKYKYWEPGDQWKGDFARGYFYMATAYHDFKWQGDAAVRILTTGDYPTLQEWAYKLYLEWAANDEVDEIETTRNNNVEKMQGNRNPFVDFPKLADYIWGDSIGEPFHPLTTIKSQPSIGGSTIREKGKVATEIYASSFLNETGNCTTETAAGSASGFNVWYNTAEYGWKGSGTRGTTGNITYYNTDATLFTPEFDLTEYQSAWLEFDHAVNYATAPYSNLSVVVKVDGNTHPLYVRRWPLGNTWDFFNSSVVDLSDWAGKKVKVGFHYTSTEGNAPTWEIKNFQLFGVAGKLAVDPIEAEMITTEENESKEYYTIDGRHLNSIDNIHGSVIILRQGSKVSKLFIP